MSDNTSEVDQITHEFGRATTKIAQTIGAWRILNPNATTVPRNVRREINSILTQDARDQRHAHAEERSSLRGQLRVYRWKLLTESGIRSADTLETWFERQRLLAQTRDRIETLTYSSPYLNAIERGQIETTLAGIHRDPHTRIGLVFSKPTGLNALRARLHDGLTRLRAGWAIPSEQSQLLPFDSLHSDRRGPAQQRPDRGRWRSDMNIDPDAPIDLNATDLPAPQPFTATPAPLPQVTVEDLTSRINRYRVWVQYRNQHPGDPAEMTPVDRATARLREQIRIDAQHLGPDQAALVDMALFGIDQLHHEPPDRDGFTPTDQDHRPGTAATGIDRDQEHAPLDHETGGFRVEVSSDPNPGDSTVARRIDTQTFGTPAEALLWAQQQLANHDNHAAVRLYANSIDAPEQQEPIYKVVGRIDVIAAQLGDDSHTIDRDGHAEGTPAAAPERPEPGPAEPERNYDVTVGSADFVRNHPDMAKRAQVTTLADGYTWALDQLGDDGQGWPAGADVTVHIHHPGAEAPIYESTADRDTVINEVITWQENHEKSPLAEIEKLRTELRAAHTEVEQLRTENTEFARQFAEHAPTLSTATTPPTGPRLAHPIFAGPVINQPLFDGVDR
ncbi:hypothetical protein AB0N05_15065 [Nocardia sp. NPDC051030]|uniref:hypothetical protein n=1 Tax=Nocardia sp. NPDC051030 TaxID=3155162 RepID=UPI003421DF9B